MIDRFFVLALALLVLGNFFGALANTINWRRLAKLVRVTYQQMSGADRQTCAMGAGIVVFFIWWSVAIVKGW